MLTLADDHSTEMPFSDLIDEEVSHMEHNKRVLVLPARYSDLLVSLNFEFYDRFIRNKEALIMTIFHEYVHLSLPNYFTNL